MARMPSTRTQPLNPSVAGAPAGKPAKPAPAPAPGTDAKAPEAPVDEQEESQRNGLEVNESEWPADTTIPGALGDR
jgi:hypothetical protein